MQKVYDEALAWFLANFTGGHHASLNIVAYPSKGPGTMIKVFAQDDADMIAKARSEVRRAGAAGFVGFGEGSLQDERGPVPILLMYLQAPADAFVRRAVTEYRWEGGKIVFSPRWKAIEGLSESWTVQSVD